MNILTNGSLFCGIGGLDEGAKMAGIKTVWAIDHNPYAGKIFKQVNQTTNFHDQDIKLFRNFDKVNIVSGGFPCQDISLAGGGKGIFGDRSSLWREMYRICREIRPEYILIENSPALTFRGLEYILSDLAKIGYDAEWQCLSNLCFGYPHKRERIYIIAYPNSIRQTLTLQIGSVFTSVFKQWSSKASIGYSIAKGIQQLPEVEHFRSNDGTKYWSHRVTGIGNSVNKTVAYYLYKSILSFHQNLNVVGNSCARDGI